MIMRVRVPGAVAIVVAAFSAASAAVADRPLDGAWRSEGYGLYFDISGATVKAYELTAISCLPSFTAERTGVAAGDSFYKVADESSTFIIKAGGSADRRLLHNNGAASDIVIRRLASAPAQCAQPIADTPLNNFDVFTRTWAEQYGFFDLRKTDWRATTARQRAKINDRTSPQQLFEILKDMIEPFGDAHTRIAAESIKQSFYGLRKSDHWLPGPDRARAFEITEQKYVRGPLRSWCNGHVQYGRLDSGIGYLRLKSFSNFGPEPGFESGSAALEKALDEIFADAPSWRGLVIDVRINGGGDDPWGLAIASRLATSPYIAYAKQARSDPDRPDRWTDPQPSEVRSSTRPSFHGRVVELIGINSVSAAETFTQALLNRTPKVTRIGENTQGVFSDVLGRRLPNGWIFGLPNERFVTGGKTYDGAGIPPDVLVPVFPRADLDAGRDGALEKALELVSSSS